MTDVVAPVANAVSEVVSAVTPSSPVAEVAAAVAETVANPSAPVLVEDLLLVHKIAGEVKAQLAGKHPTLSQIFWSLFHA